MTFEFDYEDAEAFLVGTCHKTIHECMLVSMEEFRYLAKAEERRQQVKWEQLRWLSYNNLVTIPFAKKGTMPKTVQDYCTFPWETVKKTKKTTGGALTDGQIAELYRLYTYHKEHQS